MYHTTQNLPSVIFRCCSFRLDNGGLDYFHNEASHDFLHGYYPFDGNERSDLANLSALQLLAKFGSVDPEQYVDGKSYVDKCRPMYIGRGKDRRNIISLNKEITDCYLSMKDKMEKEEAERMFVSKLRKLRYRNSVFFCVGKIADPSKFLKGGDKIVLAINSFGMYFMKHDPRKCLHTAELKDIKKYGCSDEKFTLTMQVEDGMHEFAFATKRAEEIIVALEIAIQDQMNRRGTKASSADSDVSQPPDVSVCDSNQILTDFFQRNQNPSPKEIGSLSKQVGLDGKRIKAWFSYKRFSEKKRASKSSGKKPTRIKELPPNLKRILTDFFQRNQNPNKQQKIDLATKVGLDLEKITRWFSDTRFQENKKRGKGHSSGTAVEKIYPETHTQLMNHTTQSLPSVIFRCCSFRLDNGGLDYFHNESISHRRASHNLFWSRGKNLDFIRVVNLYMMSGCQNFRGNSLK